MKHLSCGLLTSLLAITLSIGCGGSDKVFSTSLNNPPAGGLLTNPEKLIARQ